VTRLFLLEAREPVHLFLEMECARTDGTVKSAADKMGQEEDDEGIASNWDS
jgi:hypothetical protein